MKTVLALTLLSLALVGCGSVDTGGSDGRQRVRYVTLPYELNNMERDHLSQVVDLLRDYGFEPMSAGMAGFQLSFSIEEGPINVDTNIALKRAHTGMTVAGGFGRDGGPRKLVNHAGVVQNSVQAALDQFAEQLDQLPDDPEPAFDPGYSEDYPGYNGGGIPPADYGQQEAYDQTEEDYTPQPRRGRRR